MNRLNILQTSLVVLFVSFSIGLSYEIDFGEKIANYFNIDDQVAKYFPLIIGVAISAFSGVSAFLFADYLLSVVWIRKAAMGSADVEGHWLIETYPDERDSDDQSPLLLPGILYISYERSSREMIVITTRYNNSGEKYVTHSEVSFIRTSGPKIRYLNFFKIGIDRCDRKYGFSSGEFFRQHSMPSKPSYFVADLSIENDTVTRRQFAQRIPERSYIRYAKTFGEEWIKVYLATKGRAFSMSGCNESVVEEKQNIIQKLQNKSLIEDDRRVLIEQFLKKAQAGS